MVEDLDIIDRSVYFYIDNYLNMSTIQRREALKELISSNISFDSILYLLNNVNLKNELDFFIPKTINTILVYPYEYLSILYYKYGISCKSLINYIINSNGKYFINLDLFSLVISSQLYTESEKIEVLTSILDYSKDKCPEYLMNNFSARNNYPDFYLDLYNIIMNNSYYQFGLSYLYYFNNRISNNMRKSILDLIFLFEQDGVISVINSPCSTKYFNDILVSDNMSIIKRRSRIKERKNIYKGICSKLKDYPMSKIVYDKCFLYDDFDINQLLDYFIEVKDVNGIFTLAINAEELSDKLFNACILYGNSYYFHFLVSRRSNISIMPMLDRLEKNIDKENKEELANSIIKMARDTTLNGQEAYETYEKMLDLLIKIKNNKFIIDFCECLYLNHKNDIPYESIADYIITCNDDVIINVTPYICDMSVSLWNIVAAVIIKRKNSDSIFRLMLIDNAPINVLNEGLKLYSNKEELIDYLDYDSLSINIKNLILGDLLLLDDFNCFDSFSILRKHYKFDKSLVDRIINSLIDNQEKNYIYNLCLEGFPMSSKMASFLISSCSYQELVELNMVANSKIIGDYLNGSKSFNINEDVTDYIIDNIDEFLKIGLAGIINVTGADKSLIFMYLSNNSDIYGDELRFYYDFLNGNVDADAVDQSYFDYSSNSYSLKDMNIKKGRVFELK